MAHVEVGRESARASDRLQENPVDKNMRRCAQTMNTVDPIAETIRAVASAVAEFVRGVGPFSLIPRLGMFLCLPYCGNDNDVQYVMESVS